MFNGMNQLERKQMALQKHVPSGGAPPVNIKPLSFSIKKNVKVQPTDSRRGENGSDLEVDLREVYFLIMHFLSAGPCQRASGQLWNELLEHQLLPRRYHSWYSRSGGCSRHEDDDGMSLPLSYSKLVERYPHVEKDHLVKLLKQLILNAANPAQGLHPANALNAAAVPTLLGTGSFSLLSSEQHKRNSDVNHPPGYMRWPHMKADQVRGLSLREIGGGFARHHRAPSVRAASYAIEKPFIMLQKMQNRKRVRGHRSAVYCSIFDRSGRYVITGSDDRLVKIWSMETAFCLASCRGHEGDITDLAVSFNNAMVASASNDCIIRVWRLCDGMPISVLRGHTGAVTAIAFSPRPSSPGHLLSSSDDGTCRVWEARNSQLSPRVYIPKPAESTPGKNNCPTSSTTQQTHQIFCCAFNASGTVFVTGSSDTRARVWNACKFTPGDSDQPNHEMDILSGHENDVNYVQFSGCAVPCRFSSSDATKDGNVSRFKNTSYNQDNIVTCSRDGSAIIWIPKSRRSHGKSGRWTRAYHLKVPPPPLPPQPPRGGPRQRILPTPRGVNMIVWSLDNRFVLAAIMDCRICVWNAADGSLVHSLTGHTESTYVLDVHPFNPRIAMSAGYDGKTIVWDIWEGVPVSTYDIGRFKLVDGKFSPDGTSIILSDDVGQLYILTTGQGESQKDAKYDQFFLGDYRPLVQDTHGNVLDQETQLIPYRRNMQDLLCDSGMIPYPEPYQSSYQKRRLGALGYEWRPSSFRFAVGTDISLDQEYQMPPIADLDFFLDPQFMEAMDWEPEIEIQSDDADSEYNVTEEYSSAGEQAGLDTGSGSDFESCENNGEADNSEQDGLRTRRSKRKKVKADAEVTTSSGRRVKRRNLDEDDDGSFIRHRARKAKVRKGSRKKLSSSKSLRPQRAAARNALNLFSRITGASTDGEEEEEEYSTVGDSSENESLLDDTDVHSDGSNLSMQNELGEHSKGKEILVDKSEDIEKLDRYSEYRVNAGAKRRLVLKLPKRDSSQLRNPQITKLNGRHEQPSTSFQHPGDVHFNNDSASGANGFEIEESKMTLPAKVEHCLDLTEGYKDGHMSWGVVRARSSKRLKMGEPMPVVEHTQSIAVDAEESETASLTTKVQNGDDKKHEAVPMDEQNPPAEICETRGGTEHRDTEFFGFNGDEKSLTELCQNSDGLVGPSVLHLNGENNNVQFFEKPPSILDKLHIKSRTFLIDQESQSNSEVDSVMGKSSGQDVGDATLENLDCREKSDPSVPVSGEVETPSSENLEQNVHPESGCVVDKLSKSPLLDLLQQPSQNRMFTAVYRRSKSSKGRRGNQDIVNGNIGASTSAASNPNMNDTHESAIDGARQTRSIRLSSNTHDPNVTGSITRSMGARDGSGETPTSSELTPMTEGDEISAEDKRPGRTATMGLRSARTRRASCYARDLSPPERPERRKTNQSSRSSWLMMSTHEEGSRYIPQLADEVAYLRQGHEEYMNHSHLRNAGPWSYIKGNMKAVEFCKVEELEYSHLSGSGESCCKMTLSFVDPTSSVFGRSFKLTLPEVTSFPDFLVERSRYDASLARNWAFRDKCQVWWKDEGEESGSWWEGRIVSVKPKSLEFPDSPWERYVVQYKSEPREQHPHSPWELYDSDTHWELPHIDEDIKEKLLLAFSKMENKKKDYYGVNKLKEVSQTLRFANRFPVPLTVELIRSRLENNYYRSLEAFEHDVKVLMSNAETHFGGNPEVSTKLKRLSDFFSRTLSS